MTRDQANALHEYHLSGFDVHYRGERLSDWRTGDGGTVLTMTRESVALDDPHCWIPVQILDARQVAVYAHEIVENWEEHG